MDREKVLNQVRREAMRARERREGAAREEVGAADDDWVVELRIGGQSGSGAARRRKSNKRKKGKKVMGRKGGHRAGGGGGGGASSRSMTEKPREFAVGDWVGLEGQREGEEKQEQEEEGEDCCICFLVLAEEDGMGEDGVATLPCDHQYHRDCLGLWLEKCREKDWQQNCPLCRHPL